MNSTCSSNSGIMENKMEKENGKNGSLSPKAKSEWKTKWSLAQAAARISFGFEVVSGIGVLGN